MLKDKPVVKVSLIAGQTQIGIQGTSQPVEGLSLWYQNTWIKGVVRSLLLSCALAAQCVRMHAPKCSSNALAFRKSPRQLMLMQIDL